MRWKIAPQFLLPQGAREPNAKSLSVGGIKDVELIYSWEPPLSVPSPE